MQIVTAFKGGIVGAFVGWLIGYMVVYARVESVLAEAGGLAQGLIRATVASPVNIAFAPDTIFAAVIGAVFGALGVKAFLEHPKFRTVKELADERIAEHQADSNDPNFRPNPPQNPPQ